MPQRKITIATLFTLSRFVLVIFFIFQFESGLYPEALLSLSLAGLTDFLDGFIARRFHQRSRLGSMLDPLADKFLMLAGYVLMSHLGKIPWTLTYLIVSRDFLILAGAGILLLMKVKLLFRPTRFSKLATFSQIMVLILAFADFLKEKNFYTLPLFMEKIWPPIQAGFFYTAFALTCITVFQYGYIAYKFYRYGERKA
ncbi:MAG TPA: hypothetical protein DDW49_00980 [Deltaproteobacteria bacterium]|nr:MAG: hypothetical protein A2048_07595 [Deltaproteobacteria bacterium GWA2_45_12]HBF11956.1 hypothetical protein [Deltaproteobacteria bacterium]